MEIRDYDKIVGVVTTDAIVEGKFGLLTSQSTSIDFGSQTDLAGFKLPVTADDAKRARYVLAWAVNNQKFPAFLSYPSYSYSLRPGAFDQATNLPATMTLYASNPANQIGMTIPSGMKALALAGGIVTIASGAYIDNVGLHVAGAAVTVAYTDSDGASEAGKLKYSSTFSSDTCVGIVREYESSTGRLTVILE